MVCRLLTLVLVACLLVTQRAALPHVHADEPPDHDTHPHTHLPGEDDDDHDADAIDLGLAAVPTAPPSPESAPLLALPPEPAYSRALVHVVTDHAVWWPQPPPARPLYLLHRALLR